MQIDLSEKIEVHFKRVEALADEAADDEGGESFSSRASAMTALTNILEKLVKQQEKVWNMQRQQRVEQALIDTVKVFLTEKQIEHLIEELQNLHVS